MLAPDQYLALREANLPLIADYPRVTEMLSKTKDDTFLKEWRARIGEDEANRITKKACSNGTRFHSLIENFLLNTISPQEDGLPQTLFNAWWLRFKDRNIKPIVIECPLWSHKLRLKGTVDCVAMWNDDLMVFDWKSTTNPKRSEWIEDYYLQGTAYALMYDEIFNQFPSLVLICIAGPTSYQEFSIDPLEYVDILMNRREAYNRQYEEG